MGEIYKKRWEKVLGRLYDNEGKRFLEESIN
jgi:hypothetical protein